MKKSRKASQKEVFHKGLQCNFKGLKQAIQAYFTFPLQLPQGKIGFSKHGICFQNTVLFKNYLQCKSSQHYFIVNLVDSIVINFLERKQIEVDVLLNCFFLQKKRSAFTTSTSGATLFSTTLNSFLRHTSLRSLENTKV